MNAVAASRTTITAAMIGFLKRSQKKRVSSATSRDGGGAVGINVVCWISLKPGEVVLCHAKVSRASVGERAYLRDSAWWDNKILSMNAFWNSFETLLGLGAEARNLTFVQISLCPIVVFLSHWPRSGSDTNARFRGKLHTVQRLFLLRLAGA